MNSKSVTKLLEYSPIFFGGGGGGVGGLICGHLLMFSFKITTVCLLLFFLYKISVYSSYVYVVCRVKWVQHSCITFVG